MQTKLNYISQICAVKKPRDFLTKQFKIGHSATLVNYALIDNITTISEFKNMYVGCSCHILFYLAETCVLTHCDLKLDKNTTQLFFQKI